MDQTLSDDELEVYRKFLLRFSADEKKEVRTWDDRRSEFMRAEELEGECKGWTVQYLLVNGCSEILAHVIARLVYAEAKKLDIDAFFVDIGEQKIDKRSSKEENCKKQIEDIQFLDAGKLRKVVLDIVHRICSDFNTIRPHLKKTQSKHEVCFHSIKNSRRKMEDVHVVCTDLNSLFNLKDCSNHSFYSVFDGHGGIEAASYAANHLHVNLVHNPNFLTDPETAFKQAYKETDEGFLIKAERTELKSGTTGVSVLIRESKMYLAWLGDSMAVLVRNGQALEIMTPHKPDRADEKERIEKLGGVVVWFGAWRVNGSIAVARAIGDKVHKPFISSDADVTSIDLDGNEDFIVLACDGVWDVISPGDIPELVYNHIQENNGERNRTAHRIIEVAKESGSNDNITVIVVFLREEMASPQGKMHFNFQTSEKH